MELKTRLLERKDLKHRSDEWHSQGKTVVLTNGCFDLLHAGHLRTFWEAKKYGDILLVGINSDQSVRGLKGPTRPIVSELDRASLLTALRPVDYVTIFGETDAVELIRAVHPDIYVKGGDYTLDNLPEKKVILELGVEVRFIPLVAGISTSELVTRIRHANL